ncbi:MAG: hypothetical protein ACJ8DZ_14135 [Allosphingosinicella sp.]
MADDGIFSRIGKAFRTGGVLPGDPGTVDQAADEGGIEKARAVPTKAIGSSMTALGGESYYAERRLNLNGQQRWNVYEDMTRDVAIIAAGLRLIVGLLANAVWTVNPPDDVPEGRKTEAQKWADLLYEIIFDMTSSWSTVVRKVALFRFAGFSLMEWTAKRREDGAIGLLDIEHRPQRTISRWLRDPSGTVIAVKQRTFGKGDVEIPRSKLVYAVDDTLTDEPEGIGLFRHLAPTADRLREFLELEEAGFVTDLRGIPVARAPLGELKKEVEAAGDKGSPERAEAETRRQAMLRPMREFIEKHVRNKQTGVLLPSDTYISEGDKGNTQTSVPKWAIDLLNGESQAFEAVAAAIKEMKQDLARLIGVEHLLLGSDGAGSLALARSKIGMLALTISSTLQELVEVFDRDIIAPVAELNGVPDDVCPQMGVNEISDRDIEQLLDALSKLATAGAPMMPDDPAVGEVYDMLGLTRPPERGTEADLSLNPKRNDPKDPNKSIDGNPEDKPVADTAKARVIKSRRRRPRPAPPQG